MIDVSSFSDFTILSGLLFWVLWNSEDGRELESSNKEVEAACQDGMNDNGKLLLTSSYIPLHLYRR